MSINTESMPTYKDDYEAAAWAQEYAKLAVSRENNIEALARNDVDSKTDFYRAANLVDVTTKQRHQQISSDFPKLKRQNYSSDEAYKQALVEQYGQLKYQRYEYTCYNEGAKAYNFTREVTQDASCGGSKAMNAEIWSGCERYLSKHPDKIEQFNDSCYARVVPDVTNTLRKSQSTSMNCCAVSSKSLVSKVCSEMGYDGNDNFVVPQHGQQAYLHRSANGIIHDTKYKQYSSKGNLWDLIDAGKVGSGDMVAINVGNATNTTTGYHAKTIVAVERDKNGKLLSYTTHGNNNTNFSTVTSRASSPTVYAVSTNKWMKENIAKEQNDMQNMSISEIENMVAGERQKVNDVIDNLNTTEKNLFNSKHNISSITTIEKRYVASLSAQAKEQAMEEYRQSQTYQQNVEFAKSKYGIMSYDAIVAEAQKRLHTSWTGKDVSPQEIKTFLDSQTKELTPTICKNNLSYEIKASVLQIQQITTDVANKNVDLVIPLEASLNIDQSQNQPNKDVIIAEMKKDAENAKIFAEAKFQNLQNPSLEVDFQSMQEYQTSKSNMAARMKQDAAAPKYGKQQQEMASNTPAQKTIFPSILTNAAKRRS